MSMAVKILAVGVSQDGKGCENGEIACCFPLSVAPWPFTQQPPASMQWQWHIWQLQSGCMHIDLQQDLPDFVQTPEVDKNIRLGVAEGATVGCVGRGAERVGGGDEANHEGRDNLRSAHAKKEQ